MFCGTFVLCVAVLSHLFLKSVLLNGNNLTEGLSQNLRSILKRLVRKQNIVLVSGVLQHGSVMHIQVSILFQILLPFRLLQNTEKSSLCYTVSLCWLFLLNIVVDTLPFIYERRVLCRGYLDGTRPRVHLLEAGDLLTREE